MPTCPTCNEAVFHNEVTQFDGASYHNNCFCCGHCRRNLRGGEHCDHKEPGEGKKPYCHTCYRKLFGPRGIGNGLGDTGGFAAQKPPHAAATAAATAAKSVSPSATKAAEDPSPQGRRAPSKKPQTTPEASPIKATEDTSVQKLKRKANGVEDTSVQQLRIPFEKGGRKASGSPGEGLENTSFQEKMVAYGRAAPGAKCVSKCKCEKCKAMRLARLP